MKNIFHRKCMIIGLIILLIGSCIISGPSAYINNKKIKRSQSYEDLFFPGKSIINQLILDKITKTLNPIIIIDIKMGQCVQQTEDNGYIVTGFSGDIDLNDPNSSTLMKTLIIKYDEYGKKEWSKTFEFMEGNMGYSIQQTADKGYIIGGSTASLNKSYAMLLKIDEQGNNEWIKTYEGLGISQGFVVQQTNDSGYILSGSSISINNTNITHVLLIKTDENGNEDWSNTFRYKNISIGNSVQQTEDLGYIITGYTGDTNWTNPWAPMENEVLLIKTDENGSEEWNKTFEFMKVSMGYSVQKTDDKGYIICGTTFSSDDFKTYALLLKTDENGDEEWHKTFSNKDGHSVQQTNDKGYILGGTAISGFHSYALLLKTDEQGNEEWTKTYKGSGEAIGLKAQQTNDNGYILTGATYNSLLSFKLYVLLLKTDENGDIEWIKLETTDSIKAKAKNTFSTKDGFKTHEDTITFNQQVNIHPLIQKIIKRFPNAFPILRTLLGL
ncbi:MAG: hypothetical protein JSW06_11020 [Thermoplasmatales archaeon]|nr:MAG: hypothetical protein JSW06_11020 [Thermoplasmatales archaeon]